jgi:transcriptional regulator with PAS, ATPase and Fis domain
MSDRGIPRRRARGQQPSRVAACEGLGGPPDGHGGCSRPGMVHPIVGSSSPFRRALDRAESAAASDVPVLLLGESGTGKEVVARHLHACSPRRSGPFLAVNAAALPFHLLESELFGHERGAFTGADRQRNGLLRDAAGGSVLIDEIGDLPMELQAKLLRVLQEREVRPVGGAHAVAIDVRVISATHQDLARLVERGRFRLDLWYRIGVFTIELPPLRARPGDVEALAGHFLRAHSKGAPRSFAPQALAALRAHSWPGNVRELENAVQHALVLCPPGGTVTTDHLPSAVLAGGPARASLSIWQARDDAERERIERALRAAAGNRTQAARELGMSRQSLPSRLLKYGIGPGAGRPGTRFGSARSPIPPALGAEEDLA